MDSIREQMELTNEISDAISNPVGMGNMVDEVGCRHGPRFREADRSADIQDELNAELEAMQQEELDERLAGAERVPSHMPSSPVGVTSGRESKSLYGLCQCVADIQGSRKRQRRTTRKRNCVNSKRSWPCRFCPMRDRCETRTTSTPIAALPFCTTTTSFYPSSIFLIHPGSRIRLSFTIRACTSMQKVPSDVFRVDLAWICSPRTDA